MLIGILKEHGTEKRVAMLPAEAAVLKNMGLEIIVEFRAGEKAFATDNEYSEVGAKSSSRNEILTEAEFILSVNPIPEEDLKLCREGQIICCLIDLPENIKWLEQARLRGLTVLGLDLIPRTTRAQSMDILSSMSTVSGYKAVLDAASALPKFFPMFMSAAGTIKPARVLILGAGVAGLQALAVARKLGAVVEVFDVRSAVKEEIMSLGGKFIEVEGAKEDTGAGGYAIEQTDEYRTRQQELISKHAKASDAVIATAQIPGKKAPILLLKETIYGMKPGSLVVDLAASSGGNCELTQSGKTIEENGVKIIGKSDYPSDMPIDASKMFGRNIINLLKIIVFDDGKIALDMQDDIISCMTAVREKEYISQRVKQIINIK